MYLDINTYYYNKTITKDGITQQIDTSKNYLGYMVQICQNYTECETKEDMLIHLIYDLKKTANELEQELNKGESKKLKA